MANQNIETQLALRFLIYFFIVLFSLLYTLTIHSRRVLYLPTLFHFSEQITSLGSKSNNQLREVLQSLSDQISNLLR
jgi:uncharacterized protein HemY